MLAGLVNLCVGEMPTHCCSGYLEQSSCPRCSKRDPGEVLGEILAIMSTAMKRVNPRARLIAWPYSQYLVWGEQKTVDSIKHFPEDVVIQYNFESRGRAEQLGKMRTLDDYWLAWPGPSELFRTCASSARERGLTVAAKLQLGCAYELATVPYVPVPGIVYDKYRAMRELGVSAAMHCWLVGGAPSLMHKAACLLSFEPFPESREMFLSNLAHQLWPRHADTVRQAWSHFEAGYRNYPFSRIFSYYSPLNSGPTWPLYLIPRDTPLSVPYICGWPASGDRIGECLMDDLSLDEAIVLCSRMLEPWNKGLALLNDIAAYYTDDTERTKDIGIARTVGILIQSCVNILTFYRIRHELAYQDHTATRLKLLEDLQAIVHQERSLSEELIGLCQKDDRIGFHSDAEHHILYPERIRWRINMLDTLLAHEFPLVCQQIADGSDPFAEFTGKHLSQKAYVARQQSIEHANAVYCEDLCVYGGTSQNTECSLDIVYGRATSFRACRNDRELIIEVTCMEPDLAHRPAGAADRNSTMFHRDDYVAVHIEPKRGYPARHFLINPAGAQYHQVFETPMNYDWTAKVRRLSDRWIATYAIPWHVLMHNQCPTVPLRINVSRCIRSLLDSSNYLMLSWHKPYPDAPSRLLLGDMNPANMAWMTFDMYEN